MYLLPSSLSFYPLRRGVAPFRDDEPGERISRADAPFSRTLMLMRRSAPLHGLMSGAVQPSAVIRMHQPGQLIARGQTLTDAQILRKQGELKEGLSGRILGTNWLLLSPDTPEIAAHRGKTAAEALDGVPLMPVLDVAAPA